MCQEYRGALPLIPWTETGKSAAELWKRLPGFSAAILLRARVDARAYVDVFYGDEEQRGTHVLTLKYVVM